MVATVIREFDSHKYNKILKILDKLSSAGQLCLDLNAKPVEPDRPFGGLLTEAEADISRSLPNEEDRALFQDLRQKALQVTKDTGENQSKVKTIHFGDHEVEAWYVAPYPEEYAKNKALFICEYCLQYFQSAFIANRHRLKCNTLYPPGNEIYRDGSISLFEVDGRKSPSYCQNLCLLAKMFLGSKTLYYDVEPFFFYILTERDSSGYRFLGYFSKEKRSSSGYNVSCILTLPINQRKGFGSFLIDFSYLLSERESRTGSPEKPLSDLGLASYRKYWQIRLSYYLKDVEDPISIEEISKRTHMTVDDVISSLELMKFLNKHETDGYRLCLDKEKMKSIILEYEGKNSLKLKKENLLWCPLQAP